MDVDKRKVLRCSRPENVGQIDESLKGEHRDEVNCFK